LVFPLSIWSFLWHLRDLATILHSRGTQIVAIIMIVNRATLWLSLDEHRDRDEMSTDDERQTTRRTSCLATEVC
jgi:hypothetical protein